MDFFRFSFDGSWLGGIVVVAAKDLIQARKLAKRELHLEKDRNSLVLEKRWKFLEPGVVYIDEGEY